jgi:hypothetical protein
LKEAGAVPGAFGASGAAVAAGSGFAASAGGALVAAADTVAAAALLLTGADPPCGCGLLHATMPPTTNQIPTFLILQHC